MTGFAAGAVIFASTSAGGGGGSFSLASTGGSGGGAGATAEAVEAARNMARRKNERRRRVFIAWAHWAEKISSLHHELAGIIAARFACQELRGQPEARSGARR